MFVLAIQTDSAIKSREDIVNFLADVAMGLLAGADSAVAADKVTGRPIAHFMFDDRVNPEVVSVDFRDVSLPDATRGMQC